MKLNNKKRQSAVYSTRMINVYLRMLRGQKVRNGSFLTNDYPCMPLIPNTIKKEISKAWDNFHKQILATMPISFAIKEGKYDIKQD